MWWVMMLSTHRDIKVKEGAAGSDRGHLCVAVDLSSLQHVRTKLSNTHLSCRVKGVCSVHVCVWACVCVRMLHLCVSLCMCTYCLSCQTEQLKWMIGSKAFFQAFVFVQLLLQQYSQCWEKQRILYVCMQNQSYYIEEKCCIKFETIPLVITSVIRGFF